MNPTSLFISITLSFFFLLTGCHKEDSIITPEEKLALNFDVSSVATLNYQIQDVHDLREIIDDCPFASCSEQIKNHLDYFQGIANQKCQAVYGELNCCDYDGNPMALIFVVYPNNLKCVDVKFIIPED